MRTRAFGTLLLLFLLGGCAGATGQTPSPEGAAATSKSDSLGLHNERHPAEGLITGGQPTERVLEAAAEAGVDVVVRLRTPEEPMAEEEAAKVRALGMRYVTIPVAGKAGLTRENAVALHEALSTSERALVHCGSGNRAGSLLALRAFFVLGDSAEQALELGRAAGMTSLEPHVRAILQSAQP